MEKKIFEIKNKYYNFYKTNQINRKLNFNLIQTEKINNYSLYSRNE